MLRPKSSIQLHNHNSTYLLDQAFHPKDSNLATITLSSLDNFLTRYGNYVRKRDSQYHEFALQLRSEIRGLFLDEKKTMDAFHSQIQSLVFQDPDALVPTAVDHAQDFTITFGEPESWNGIRLLLIYDQLFYRVHLTQCSDSWNYDAADDPYKTAHRARNEAGRTMRRYLSKCHKAVNQLYVDIKDGRTPVSWFDLQKQKSLQKTALSNSTSESIEMAPADTSEATESEQLQTAVG